MFNKNKENEYLLCPKRKFLTCHLFCLQYSTPARSQKPQSGREFSGATSLFHSTSFF